MILTYQYKNTEAKPKDLIEWDMIGWITRAIFAVKIGKSCPSGYIKKAILGNMSLGQELKWGTGQDQAHKPN